MAAASPGHQDGLSLFAAVIKGMSTSESDETRVRDNAPSMAPHPDRLDFSTGQGVCAAGTEAGPSPHAADWAQRCGRCWPWTVGGVRPSRPSSSCRADQRKGRWIPNQETDLGLPVDDRNSDANGASSAKHGTIQCKSLNSFKHKSNGLDSERRRPWSGRAKVYGSEGVLI
jgi:hypothetical protein